MSKVLVIGEVVWDIFTDRDNLRKLGGAPANCANRLSEAGHQVSLLTGLGKDADGREAAEILARHTKLDLSLVQYVDPPTGTVPISEVDGRPQYTITPDVAFDQIALDSTLCELLPAFEVVYFNTLIQRTDSARATLNEILDLMPNALKVVDLNLRDKCYTKKSIEFCFKNADVVKISDDELEILVKEFDLSAGNLGRSVIDLKNRFKNVETLYVTLGEEGAIAIDSFSGRLSIDAGYNFPDDMSLDTVGCGDSFFAGALQKKLEGANLLEQIKHGNILGAINATQEGALNLIPAEAITAFIADPVARASHSYAKHVQIQL